MFQTLDQKILGTFYALILYNSSETNESLSSLGGNDDASILHVIFKCHLFLVIIYYQDYGKSKNGEP